MRRSPRTTSRRALLTGGAIATGGLAAAATGVHVLREGESGKDPRAGLEIVFEDDFNELESLDLYASRAQPLWFTDLPYGWGENRTKFTVRSSILRIEQRQFNANWALCSWSPAKGVGRSFGFGYFEAKMRFDRALGVASEGWPAFWSLPVRRIQGDTPAWPELDFFEAFTGGRHDYDGKFYGVIHEWRMTGARHAISSRYPFDAPVGDDDWHVYGCRWERGRVQWFLDDDRVGEQEFDEAGCRPPCHVTGPSQVGEARTIALMNNPEGGLAVILGSGPEWPLEVDWVKVWS